MNHIKKDILFSLIDGNLGEDLRKEAEDHLATCDRCFTLYASLKSSNVEIENADIEETPHDLYIKAESEMGNIQILPKVTTGEEIHIPKERYEHIKADASYDDQYEKVSIFQQISKYSSRFIPLAFVAVIAVIVYNNQQIDEAPIAEESTPPAWKTQDPDQTLQTSKDATPLTNDAKKTNLAKNLMERMAQKERPIVLAYYDPSENTMVTRSIPGSRKVPDLIGKNLEEIEVLLKSQGIRYIVYKYAEFKQFPEPNKYLMSNDTLKIYYK